MACTTPIIALPILCIVRWKSPLFSCSWRIFLSLCTGGFHHSRKAFSDFWDERWGMRSGSSHLASPWPVDQGEAVGSQAWEWLEVYQWLISAVLLFLCPFPWPSFTSFLLDVSLHLHPVHMLVLGTRGSRVVFAVSHESLETENLKGILWVSGCKIMESFSWKRPPGSLSPTINLIM